MLFSIFELRLNFKEIPTDSGHGGRTPDKDGDEVDGYDEGQP